MVKTLIWFLCLVLSGLPVPSLGRSDGGPELKTGRTPIYGYRVVRAYPHDRRAFTQGLVYERGFFYEGTGLHGRSSLRKVELVSGRVLQEARLERTHFGEGITVFGDRIVQLTWTSRVGFVYDKASFNLLHRFGYPREGWGITHDGERLIMSDGTAVLRFLSPRNFRELSSLGVYDERGPVAGLNELEYVQGAIYANVWPTDRVAVIDPGTGRVTAWIDLGGLLEARDAGGVDVLNGIAYDSRDDRLFVTGKLWPKVFEIRTVPGPSLPGPQGGGIAGPRR